MGIIAGLAVMAWLLTLVETYPVQALAIVLIGGSGAVAIVLKLRQRRALERQRQQQARLAHVSTLGGLLTLTPTQFETAVGDLMRFWGYLDVQHTGGGGDLAADIICRDSVGRLTVVQCKRYAPGKSVGSVEVQQFIGMIVAHHRAQFGIFVTTSDFTAPARALAQQHGIRAIGGAELVAHMQQWQQVYVANLPAQPH